MSARWQSVVAVAVLVLGACGGGTDDAVSEGEPTDARPTSVAERDVASSTRDPVGTQAALPTDVDIEAALADRAALGAELERQLLSGLMEASGLSAVLGADAEAALADLLAAEDAAVRASWAERGIDPAAAVAALSAAPVPASPGATRIRRASTAGAGGVLAIVTGMAAAFEPVFMRQPDRTTGRVVDSVKVSATSTRGELALTVDERATVDLGYCPDEGGLAEGTVTVEIDLMATGTVDGKATSMRASGTFAITTEVRSDATAHLASADDHVTGTIVGTADDGATTTWADVDALGVPLDFDASGAPKDRPAHGEAFGFKSSVDAFIRSFMIAAGSLAMMHGTAAQTYWSDGGCVALEVNAKPGTEVGDSQELLVIAVHLVDLGPVDGVVTATATDGTVDPAEAAVPATFRVTVDPGTDTAYVDLEQRSFRGVAKDQASLDARSYRVALGGPNQQTLTGTKCGGAAGPWDLVIGGVVVDDGFEVTFSGSLHLEVAPDLSATYTVDMDAAATGLPPALTAMLGITGGGAARFVDDPMAPRFDLLDGDLAVAASGSGPGVSVGGIVTQGPTGASAIPVERAACAG